MSVHQHRNIDLPTADECSSPLRKKYGDEICDSVWDRLESDAGMELLQPFRERQRLMREAYETRETDFEGSKTRLSEASECETRFPPSASRHKFGVEITHEIAKLGMELLVPADLTEAKFRNMREHYASERESRKKSVESARAELVQHLASRPTCSEDTVTGQWTVERWNIRRKGLERQQSMTTSQIEEEFAQTMAYMKELEETVRKLEVVLGRRFAGPSDDEVHGDGLFRWL